jgi:hypothetical protein
VWLHRGDFGPDALALEPREGAAEKTDYRWGQPRGSKVAVKWRGAGTTSEPSGWRPNITAPISTLLVEPGAHSAETSGFHGAILAGESSDSTSSRSS